MNGSTGPKSGSPSLSAPDPLDRAREAVKTGNKATDLLEYSEDFEEKTGRTEVTVNLQQPSQPDIDVKSEQQSEAKVAVSFIKAVRGWPQAVVGLGLLALLAFVAWLKWR